MTSSALSDSEENCPKCGGPLRARQAHPYPLALQIAFGASFILFLVFGERVAGLGRSYVWMWSALQIALGVALVFARKRAKKVVLRCVRCDAVLRFDK